MDEKRNAAREWLETATKGIRFKPDRLAVEAELREHLEDKTADMARIFHIGGEEAEQEALKRMGDPEEIGKALAKLHKPWLGYLWMASRVLRWAALIAAAVFLVTTGDYYASRGGPPQWGRMADANYLRPAELSPEKVDLGGHTFRIIQAEYGVEGSLMVVVRATTPRFWARVDPRAFEQAVTVVLADGTRLKETVIEDPKHLPEVGMGVHEFNWGFFYRDFHLYVAGIDWQEGDWITVELKFPLGTVTLSAQISEGEV